jgi:hypothetical protein
MAAFARTTTHSEAVYILEAVFWQCTAMLSLLAGAPVAEILASSRRIIATLAARGPVLIHFGHHDVEGHLRRVIGSQSRWRSLVVPAYSAQAWLRQRHVTGEDGLLAFLLAWNKVSQQLFTQWPFRKTMIWEPQADWGGAYTAIRAFLTV